MNPFASRTLGLSALVALSAFVAVLQPRLWPLVVLGLGAEIGALYWSDRRWSISLAPLVVALGYAHGGIATALVLEAGLLAWGLAVAGASGMGRVGLPETVRSLITSTVAFAGGLAVVAAVSPTSLAGTAVSWVVGAVAASSALWFWFGARVPGGSWGSLLAAGGLMTIFAFGLGTVAPIWCLALLGPIVAGAWAVREWRKQREEDQAILRGLILLVQQAHPYTGAHLERVAALAENTGRNLGLNAKRAQRLRAAAILHDLGKVAIDEQILEKPSRLTDDEFAEIKRHSELGAKILEKSGLYPEISPWILAHHERPDGRGYPFGLHGDAIPLESRIIACVDAFDAMVGVSSVGGRRSYREPVDPEVAIQEVLRCAGTQFDTEVVEAFRKAVGQEVMA